MELLIGCGSNRDKKLHREGRSEWTALTTLDIAPQHNPDVVWDLNDLSLPFEDDTFDEIHAYEVLEHCGRQGDYKFFFNQWADFWRVLKPGGVFFGTVPYFKSVWALGDPSHTRIIQRENFTFLVQPQYDAQVGITPMSDFRHIYKADFDIVHLQDAFLAPGAEFLEFGLQAVKPSRCSL